MIINKFGGELKKNCWTSDDLKIIIQVIHKIEHIFKNFGHVTEHFAKQNYFPRRSSLFSRLICQRQTNTENKESQQQIFKPMKILYFQKQNKTFLNFAHK